VFETPLVPRTAPAVSSDVPWEDFRELDPVGAAQAEAEWWALRQTLDPAPPFAERPATGPGDELEAYAVPPGTAAIAAGVADLHGAELAGFLAALPPREGVDGASVIEAIVGFEKVIRWAQALQLRWIGELASRREDGRVGWVRDAKTPARPRTPAEDMVGRVGEHAAAEVAFALHTSRRAATDLLYAAVTLTRRLPQTLRAVEQGEVSARAATVAAEETCVLDESAVAAVDEVLAERLPGVTVPQARAKVRRAVLSADPGAAAKREAKARRCRSFDVTRQVVDGMGTFAGYLPIEQLVAIDERVDALARAAKAPDDPRSAGARRMDVVVDLLLGRPVVGPDGRVLGEPVPGRTWKVDVVVSEATLRGADDEPGELTGYGPITAPTARRLAGVPAQGLDRPQSPRAANPQGPLQAVWRRLVTDPLSGIVRDYGTTRYRPPAALADFVRARDRYCYAPGCRQVAARCELDHLKNSPAGPSPRPAPDGTTSDRNTGPGCSYHHRVKARPGWRVTSPEPGTYLWTTPTGHTYRRAAEPPLDPPVFEPPF
jgi:hypothetical protein